MGVQLEHVVVAWGHVTADARALKLFVGIVQPLLGGGKHLGVEDIIHALARHAAGDWGDVSDQLREVNERGLREQFNLQSSYELPDCRRLVVVTNRERTTTTVHLDAR